MPHRKLAAAIAAAGGGETDFDVDHTHGPVKPISPTAAVEPSFAGATIDSYLPYLRGKPLLHNFSRNLAAGITVSLVNVPLSIALSIASACPPMYGIVTAIWAGFLAAICGGSHFNIVGPTGALSSVLSTYAIRYGAEALPTLAVVTGILCMIYFVFHWDVYVRFLPGYVVHGFTLGVAVTIAGGQIASACGLRGLTVYPDFRDSLLEALSHIGEAQSQYARLTHSHSVESPKTNHCVLWCTVVLQCDSVIFEFVDSSVLTRSLDAAYPVVDSALYPRYCRRLLLR